MSFDPSGIAVKNGQFLGLPYSIDEAEIVLLPIPWDVTTSYRDGTAQGPEGIVQASYQIDLFSPYLKNAWDIRLATVALSQDWIKLSRKYRIMARGYIQFLEGGGEVSRSVAMQNTLAEINAAGVKFHESTYQETKQLLKQGKRVVVFGGDHSVSLGPIRAYAETEKFSVLHVDAHADLREAYEDFEHSHASIIYNIKDLPAITHITQIGIRDVSKDEIELIKDSPKITTFFDWDLKAERARGMSWDTQCDKIIQTLGDSVYLTFDIDGLDPKLCPNTGTPVAGGFELSEMLYLFEKIVKSGRKIIGADLVEVAPGKDSEWDCNVGARLLFQICCLMKASLTR